MSRSPGIACRQIYKSMQKKVATHGLDKKALDRSAAVLSCRGDKETIYLKKIAYYPTGLALGCPLPQPEIEDMLWESVRTVHLEILNGTPPGKDRGGLAFVPKSSYHTTMVNRTHFMKPGPIHCLSPTEFKASERVLKSNRWLPIIVDYRGMILTPTGALLVPGYPRDDRLFQVRQNLAADVQGFKGTVPQTAHIKLGHLLNPLDGQILSDLLVFINRQGETLEFSLMFLEVFTPLGIIAPYRP
jgi:hypothetical protein